MKLQSISKRRKLNESRLLINNLPYLQKLMKSKKIGSKEKQQVLEDVNIDIAAYLLSIGEEV